ncbi:hypothetical protein GCM10010249_29540 [Streptomyces roseolilacinus]|uniref:Uncharacterized protein n=1 Tax=Streptomyces roseolilacinus TaxID=66904 RepID=A0A918B0D4_9ACTN|nr:hypothetical protein GCM10010249_29540 [Streptomyces roseolilacinus]
MTQTSVRCSTHIRSPTGSTPGSGSGDAWRAIPHSRKTSGMDNGRPATTRGSTAAPSAPAPNNAKKKSPELTADVCPSCPTSTPTTRATHQDRHALPPGHTRAPHPSAARRPPRGEGPPG